MTLFHGTAIVETRNEINEMEFSFTGGLYITGSPDLLTVRSLRGENLLLVQCSRTNTDISYIP